jgi:hypothetical protein
MFAGYWGDEQREIGPMSLKPDLAAADRKASGCLASFIEFLLGPL